MLDGTTNSILSTTVVVATTTEISIMPGISFSFRPNLKILSQGYCLENDAFKDSFSR